MWNFIKEWWSLLPLIIWALFLMIYLIINPSPRNKTVCYSKGCSILVTHPDQSRMWYWAPFEKEYKE
jgi:hypothetical protein